MTVASSFDIHCINDSGLPSLVQSKNVGHKSYLVSKFQTPKDVIKKYNEMIAGAFSGGITRLIIAPLDVIKIRFQIQVRHGFFGDDRFYPNYQYKSIVHSVVTIFKTEGIWAFWRGNLLAELLYITYMMFQFSSYALIHDYLLNFANVVNLPVLKQPPIPLITFISGGTAALIAVTLSYPLDLMRTHHVAQSGPPTYKSINSAFYTIYRAEGVRGLYRGWCPTAMALVPSMALQFSLYDIFKTRGCQIMHKDSYAVHLIAGSSAGLLSKLAVIPLDVLKRRLQIHGLYCHNVRKTINNPSIEFKPLNMIETALNMYRYEGISVFYRGALPSIIKAAFGTAIMFSTYEQTKKRLAALATY